MGRLENQFIIFTEIFLLGSIILLVFNSKRNISFETIKNGIK